MHDQRNYWYNYVKECYELADDPATDEQAMIYLPQIDAAHGLYRVRRLQGDDIFDAMAAVLEAVLGISKTQGAREP